MASIVPQPVLAEYLNTGLGVEQFRADATEATDAQQPLLTDLSRVAVQSIVAADAGGKYDAAPDPRLAEDEPLVSFIGALGNTAYNACLEYLQTQTASDRAATADLVRQYGKFVYWSADGTVPPPETAGDIEEGLAQRIARLTMLGALRWAPLAIAAARVARESGSADPAGVARRSWRMAALLARGPEPKENRAAAIISGQDPTAVQNYGAQDAAGIASGQIQVQREFLVALDERVALDVNRINAGLADLDEPGPNETIRNTQKQGCYVLHTRSSESTGDMEAFCNVITAALARMGYLTSKY